MLDVTRLLAGLISDSATRLFRETFPDAQRGYLDQAVSMVYSALDALAGTNTLYHDVEHTAHVVSVGLEIFAIKAKADSHFSPQDWANVIIALSCHDIGYVPGVLKGDTRSEIATGIADDTIPLPADGTDAKLMPIHVDRSKRYAQEQLAHSQWVELDEICACIERTRFPAPDEPWYQSNEDLPGLVRAADFIGQLSDKRYLSKLSAIFYEFEENDTNKVFGYEKPADLVPAYPGFFDNVVSPYISAACELLRSSKEGREILASLHGNVETARRASGESAPPKRSSL